jgi:hypothetical protein
VYKLTPWNEVSVEKLIAAHLAKHFPHLIEPENGKVVPVL